MRILGVLAFSLLQGCMEDGQVLPACDDPTPALIVRAQDGNGADVLPDMVEAMVGDEVVDMLQCAWLECATWTLSAGTYRIVAHWRGEVLEMTAPVENSYACEHRTTVLEFAFEGTI